MFGNDLKKLAYATENKIKSMNHFSLGYLAISAFVATYLGFEIIFIFFRGFVYLKPLIIWDSLRLIIESP